MYPQISILLNALILKEINHEIELFPSRTSLFIIFVFFILFILLLHSIKSFIEKCENTFKSVLKVLFLIIAQVMFYILIMTFYLWLIIREKDIELLVYAAFYASIYMPLTLCYAYFVKMFCNTVLVIYSFCGTVFISNFLKEYLVKLNGYRWGVYFGCMVILFLYGKVCFILLNVKGNSNLFVKV